MKTRLAAALTMMLTTLGSCVAPPTQADPAQDEVAPDAASYANLPFKTLGGKQLWADERWEAGWRIQRSVVTGHHRLLDPRDVRRAWGNLTACEVELASRRQAGDVGAVGHHVVVLLHGIWRSKDSFAGLAAALREAGYQVAELNYPSTSWPIEGCALQVERVLNGLPATVERVSVVTHSMGGLVARQVLGAPARAGGWRERIEVDRLLMLFPPNQGAYKADAWHDHWWYRGLMGPAGQQLTSGVAASLPVPAVPTGIIAGGRGDQEGRSSIVPGDDDGTVAVARTQLEGAQHVVLDVGHTQGMNAAGTVALALSFLESGRF